MVSREEVAEVIQPLLFLERMKRWIGGLRIELRDSSPKRSGAFYKVDPRIDLEDLLRRCADCVASVANLPAPVDEQLLDNLFWLADQIALSEFDATPLPGGAVATRTGLRRATERWYAANNAAYQSREANN